MTMQLSQFRRTTLAQSAAFIAATLMTFNVLAADPFNVRDIRVEGLQRVEPGTVFASIPFRVGDDYTDEKGAAAIRSLFALGLFKDVRIEVNGDVLVLIVEERPNIAQVEFIGTKEFEKDVLRKALRDIGLAEGRPFDKALADRAEQELKRQYVNRSLYGAEIITTITPADRNRVNLSFTVIEGDLAKIKEMRVVGSKAFDESKLLDQFDQGRGNWLSWYTKSDRYSRTKLNADLETLRAWYLARGYLEFRIDSTQVAISPNKQDISITINVTEGDRFVVSEVVMDGYYLGKDDEFKSLIEIQAGKVYNADEVTRTTKAFNEYFGNFGFAFARTEVRPEIDRTTNRVKLVLVADPARRAYVRRINIVGNNRTRDQIVRREFRQTESSWYDGEKIRLSRDRVNRLGYFKEVDVDTQEVASSQDQVDLNVNVVEKPTGMLTLGAGFSSAEKVSLSFGIQQDNVFGSGHNLGLQVSTSKFNQYYVLNTTDPYFTEDGISRTFELYHRSSKPYVQQGGNYRMITSGLGVRFGLPFSELDRIFLGSAAEKTELVPGTNMLGVHAKLCQQFGCVASNVPVTAGWARDSRDSYLNPNNGKFIRLNSELGAFGDGRYAKFGGQYQQYFPITKQYTFAFNADLGIGKGLNGQTLPFYKNYYSGGLGSVRGFEQGTLGPRDITGPVIGGAKKVTVNTEFLLPFPGAGNDRSLRLYGFYDMGNVYGEFEKIDVGQLRSAYGIGLSWVSPMGPLRFAWARPIRSFAGDRIQQLQFQIGTSF
ncbi:outer membrane protein assembly factor BamA [Limnohabitans sp.]|uniref:outer membrane protein assembly factor BamA n=1 Tax=Limnohabitans sp. TaxID=1907725 RepID=UPI003FA552CE